METSPEYLLRMGVLQDLGILIAGLLLGFALTPFFATPERVAAAMGAGVGLAIVCFGWGPLRNAVGARRGAFVIVSGGMALGVASWWVTARTMVDHVPALSYSLFAPPPDEMLAYAEPGESYWYVLKIENNSNSDVLDVEITVYLPATLDGNPRILRDSYADDPTTKPRYLILAKKPPGEPASLLARQSNIVTVDVPRLLSGGTVVAIFPTVAWPSEARESGPYGVVEVKRRHSHYNVEVRDAEAFPIVDFHRGKELLGPAYPSGGQYGTPIYSEQVPAEELADLPVGGHLLFSFGDPLPAPRDLP